MRGKRVAEAVDRLRVDRLGPTTRHRPALKIAAPVLLFLKRLDTRIVCGVWRAAMGDGPPINGFEPSKRVAKKGERRHKECRYAGIERSNNAVHETIIMKIGQPTERPAVSSNRREVKEAFALVQHVMVRDHHAARRHRGSRRVLQVCERHRGSLDGQIFCTRLLKPIKGHPCDPPAVCASGQSLYYRIVRGSSQYKRSSRVMKDGTKSWETVFQSERVGRRSWYRNEPGYNTSPEGTGNVEPWWEQEKNTRPGCSLSVQPLG